MNLLQAFKQRIQTNQELPITEEDIFELVLFGLKEEENFKEFEDSLKESQNLLKEVQSWCCF